MKFIIMSRWVRIDNAFPHRFMIEFDHSDENIISSDARYFKKYKKIFVEQMKENFGIESEDWIIAKNRGPFKFGASLLVGFKHNNDAAAFILENK